MRVPAGRPLANPAASRGHPYSWEESAIDALKLKEFDKQKDWSLARALYRWEMYNGFGYRSRGVPTPYLWSFSKIYSQGKFVADGRFSKTAVSKQCGAAILLKVLSDGGEVNLGLDYVDVACCRFRGHRDKVFDGTGEWAGSRPRSLFGPLIQPPDHP